MKRCPETSPLVCARCHGGASLSVARDWTQTAVCRACDISAPLSDAFREAEAFEAAFLLGDGPKPPARFLTPRMLCALRAPPRPGDDLSRCEPHNENVQVTCARL